MRLLVCGGRQFTDTFKFDAAMSQLPFKPTVVIAGGAKGADTLAKQWAMHNGVWFVEVPALWNAHGNAAGQKRNQAMLDIMHPQYCVAFPGGNGTADMIRRCNDACVTVWHPYSVGSL